jgi:Domain of unknown function (DUF4157)
MDYRRTTHASGDRNGGVKFCATRTVRPGLTPGGGQPLGRTHRSEMEARFGHDFGAVRVHADAEAARSAESIGALAYTVGGHLVFGAGRYAPQSFEGRRLLAHELAHVVQQGAAGDVPAEELAVGGPGDAAEREADAAAERVAQGAQPARPIGFRGPAVQRQTPGPAGKKTPDKKAAGDAVVDGLKTVAEQAKDNNPKVKKAIIDPIEKRLKGEWNRFGTVGKAATIGVGAAALGMAGGAMLSDAGGRKTLEGVNLAAPFTLIPHMPLTRFKYTLPGGDGPDQRLFRFDTGFTADDLINLRTAAHGLPRMSLTVDMQWGYDPSTERLSILGGDASLGLVPGLALSAGAYKDVLHPSQTLIGPEGQMTQIKKSIPDFGKSQPIPDVRFMVNVDLTKFKPGDLVNRIKSLF